MHSEPIKDLPNASKVLKYNVAWDLGAVRDTNAATSSNNEQYDAERILGETKENTTKLPTGRRTEQHCPTYGHCMISLSNMA